MPITIQTQQGAAIITLSGEIDHHGARAMMAALEEAISVSLPHRLTLDLSGVSFMDSSGIALLLRVHRHVTQYGGTMRVTATPAQARRVLDAAGVGRLISLE